MENGTILVAPDKFKGSLSSPEVAGAIARGLRDQLTDTWTVREHPLADGGEGTVAAIVQDLNGSFETTSVRGPLGDDVEARWGLVEEDGTRTAVIEMAAASGYDLIDPEDANPMQATTDGTGQLMREAVSRDVDRLIVGLGGSATVDGGLGMARAVGFRFFDKNGDDIETPADVSDLDRVNDDDVPAEFETCSVTVCSDVDNPLLGERGAARVYGPQKGADETMVEELESNLAHWADVLEEFSGEQLRNRKGAGAAGGLGFGLAVLLDGSLVSGAETVMDVTGFNSAAESADVLITGEGRIDRQTSHGKTPVAAVRRARDVADPVTVAVAGQRSEDYDQLHDQFDVILSIVDRPMTLEDAIAETATLLERTGRDIARILTLP